MKNLFGKLRERRSLIKVVEVMQDEEAMVINDLCRQIEQKLNEMPPDEALKLIEALKTKK